MDIIVHGNIDKDGYFSPDTDYIIHELDDPREIERYFATPLMKAYNKFTGNLRRTDSGDPSPDAYATTFFEHVMYSGRSFKLSNVYNPLVYDLSLRDNGIDDCISSVQIGEAVSVVLCAQRGGFQGHRLWIIGGKGASKPDLSKIRLAKSDWNDKISSVLATTVSPLEALKFVVDLSSRL
ncbi:MAG: hypothetical protein NT080_04635 [Spirochaetes bacterium]|nr:hypothetical protein [Spirochaetota bacterium]